MPRFFLHFTDGDRVIKDPEGLELPGASAARAEALTFGRELVARQEMDWSGWSVAIHDEGGREVDLIPLPDPTPASARAA